MAILINEVVFKATVAAPAAGAAKEAPVPDRPAPADLQALVETCVEQVLRILEQRKER